MKNFLLSISIIIVIIIGIGSYIYISNKKYEGSDAILAQFTTNIEPQANDIRDEISNQKEPELTPSAKASLGQWKPLGSHWQFIISNVPYGGWLTDLDGKTYYLDPQNNGIMVTGEKNIDGKDYKFDLDGILITNNYK